MTQAQANILFTNQLGLICIVDCCQVKASWVHSTKHIQIIHSVILPLWKKAKAMILIPNDVAASMYAKTRSNYNGGAHMYPQVPHR